MRFKWLDALRGRPDPEATPETPDDRRDTGEDAYESFEEAEDESSPTGLPRIKTDDI
jgi:hypothetical protein